MTATVLPTTRLLTDDVILEEGSGSRPRRAAGHQRQAIPLLMLE